MHFDKDIDVEPSETEDLEPEALPEYTGQKGGPDPWFPEMEPFEDFLEIEERKKALEGIHLGVLPTQFTEFAFRMPRDDGLGYAPFTFNGRRHMLTPYNTPAKRVLLFCGRQVEKCQNLTATVTLANGDQVQAGKVKVGDRVMCLDELRGAPTTFTSGRVAWVSDILTKPSLRVMTRRGHELDVATTHPVRTWGGYVEAKDLRVGHRVAAVRRAGEFGQHREDPRHIELTAFMIGDGGLTQPQWHFTGQCGPVTDRFEALLVSLGATYYVGWGDNDNMDINLHAHPTIREWMRGDGLAGKYSYEKRIPSWVFDLNREDCALFLNRLWSTDGHVKQINRGKYDLVYATTSKELSRQVQALLWRFGIPTGIRPNQPSYVDKHGDPARLAYLVRIETQEGVRRFLNEIGALGKSEEISVPEVESNNNRDTFPIEINGLLRDIIRSNPRPRSGRNAKIGSLRSAGLRETLKYPPTHEKLEQYVVFFRADPAYDQALVDQLASHAESDVYWDEVESIEDIGEQDCVDFEVEDHHNFLIDGVVTHNSTLVGNFLLSRSCLITAHKSLYVSPSATQTKTFSADRVKEPIETSPVLKSFTTPGLSMNIFEKQFINRSKITLRYAFLNADRCAVGPTRVHFAGGSVATLEEIWRDRQAFIGRSVLALDTAARAPRPAKLLNVLDQGVREVFRVRLEGGAEVTCTDDQPFFSWAGWRQLRDLPVGSFVAVPRSIPHGKGESRPIEEYRLVGYLLGDGSTTTFNGTAFFSGIPGVMGEFRRCASSLGAKLGKLQDSNRKKWVHSETKRQGIYGGRRGYKSRLVALGLIGKNHFTKRVPPQFFEGSEAQIANFLGAIYATDGWASTSGNQYEIGYCSNSKGLCHDLKVLLLRFGIRSCLSRQKKPSTKKARGAYVLSIRDASSILKFCSQIHVLGKEMCFAAVRAGAEAAVGDRDTRDRLPLTYAELRARLKAVHGLSTHTAWTKHRIQLRPGNVKDSIGRRVLRDVAAKLEDSELRSLADSDVSWARIEEVTSAGEQQTYDLTVAEDENYLVDGVFIHNCRGIPAWLLALDELQDILSDNIPVIEQCTSHAPDRFKTFIYAGTPKTSDNPLEYYRSGLSKTGQSMSTMGEWVVPCDAHGGETGRHWNILGEKSIGKKSLICDKCGKKIDPMHRDAQWANMVADGVFQSFRIPQLMVPWRPWGEILLDYGRYSRDKFYNEVLGLSCDSGARPINAAQIQNSCNPQLLMNRESFKKAQQLSRSIEIFAGIDHGGGTDSSYTVLSLGMYHPEAPTKFRIFWIHRFTGEDVDPEMQLPKLVKFLRAFNVRIIGSDWGGGQSTNSRLAREFGPTRLAKYQYQGRVRRKVAFHPGLQYYQVHRTEVMTDVFEAIKRGLFEFPNWDQFRDPFAEDFLNIFSEYNPTLRMIQYDHRPGRPDDSFHSILYCFLASMILYPRPDIIRPRQELPNRGHIIGSPWTPLNQG
jgi:intein/homing endonuclease